MLNLYFLIPGNTGSVWGFKREKIYFRHLTSLTFMQQLTELMMTLYATAALSLRPQAKLCHLILYDASLINNRAGERRAPFNKDRAVVHFHWWHLDELTLQRNRWIHGRSGLLAKQLVRPVALGPAVPRRCFCENAPLIRIIYSANQQQRMGKKIKKDKKMPTSACFN